MAYTLNFTPTTQIPANSKLSVIPGLSLAYGEDVLSITSGGFLAKALSPNGGACHLYSRPIDNASVIDLTLDMTSSAAVGLMLWCRIDTNGKLQGYMAHCVSGGASTGARIARIVDGVVANSAIHSVGLALGDVKDIRIVSSVVDGSPIFRFYQRGVLLSPAAGFIDGSTSKQTGPLRGIGSGISNGTSSSADNFIDDSVVPGALTIADRAVPFCEGVLAPGTISYSGTFSGTPASLEARLINRDGTAVTGFDWSVKVASPTGGVYTIPWTGLSAGQYKMQIRDSGNASVVITGQEFAVGAILPINDQSLHEILSLMGKSPSNGFLTSVTANNCYALRPSTKDASTAVPVFAKLDTPQAWGSGYMCMADQFGIDLGANHVPTLFVDIAYSGQPIPVWAADGIPAGTGSTWPLVSGYAKTMFAWCGNRITALIRPAVLAGDKTTFSQNMDTLVGMFDALLVNQPTPYQVWISVLGRMSRDWNVNIKPHRENVYAKAISGGRYRHMHVPNLTQWQDGNNASHQSDGLTNNITTAEAHRAGNQRLGRIMGRGAAALLQPLIGQQMTLDRLGARIKDVDFTDSSMTAIRVTFDRQVYTPAGITVGIPQNWVTMTGTWSDRRELTGTMESGSKSLIIQKPSDATWSMALIYDYCRDTPFSNDTGTNNDQPPKNGGEDVLGPLLDKILHDTSGFDNGRGMVVHPEITAGKRVARVYTLTATNGSAPIPLRVKRAL